jgi:hypothetical protein
MTDFAQRRRRPGNDVPILAELRPFLAAAFEAAPEGTLHVIGRTPDIAETLEKVGNKRKVPEACKSQGG